jgi:TRAP-type mannitol/chloroaromatic compound transport system permease small subunit
MNHLKQKIERLIEAVGATASFLILVIMTIITYEVIARYAFNAPTSWAWLINRQFFGVFVMVAGSYALMHGQHIRIEVLYDRFPHPVKTAVRWLSLMAALIFLGSLLWKGGIMGLEAWKSGEKAVGMFRLPLYPLKMFIPIGTGLFILGCLVFFSRKDKV